MNLKRQREMLGCGWQTCDWDLEPTIPGVAGCYVIYAEGKPFYIGSSANVRKRIRTHKLKPTVLNRIPRRGIVTGLKVRVYLSDGEHLMREARLIRKLAPPGNRPWSTASTARRYTARYALRYGRRQRASA